MPDDDDTDRPDRRLYVPLRLNRAGVDAVDEVAADAFRGNRSAAIRALLRLGLAAWARGQR